MNCEVNLQCHDWKELKIEPTLALYYLKNKTQNFPPTEYDKEFLKKLFAKKKCRKCGIFEEE